MQEDILTEACKTGRMEKVRWLILQGVEVNSKNKNGSCALHAAALNGHHDVVRLLLDNGADPFIEDSSGRTAMVCGKEHAKVKKVIDAHLDPGSSKAPRANSTNAATPDDSGTTKIETRTSTAAAVLPELSAEYLTTLGQQTWDAANNNNVAVLRELLNRPGANVNWVNANRETALIQACYKGHTEVVRLLIDKKCDLNLREKDGWTALHWASSKGHTDILNMLLSNGADATIPKNVQVGQKLYAAADRGDVETVRSLLDKNNSACMDLNINWQNKTQETALLQACYKGNLGIVKLLVESGADINLQEEDGYSPLHWASYKGHTEVVEYLLSQGADATLLKKTGTTALQDASNPTIRDIFAKHYEVVRRQQQGLQQRGELHEFLEEEKRLKLEEENRLKLEEEKKKGVEEKKRQQQPEEEEEMRDKRLLEEEKRLKLEEEKKKELEVEKSMEQKLEEEKRLRLEEEKRLMEELELEEEKSLEQQRLEGEETRKQEEEERLKQRLVEDTVTVPELQTEAQLGSKLYTAADRGDAETVRNMLDKNNSANTHLNINWQNKTQETALMQACYKGNLGIAKLLVESGADINLQEEDGYSPLHWASYKGHAEVVEYLLSQGADATLLKKTGTTALQDASNPTIRDIFAKHYEEVQRRLLEEEKRVESEEEEKKLKLEEEKRLQQEEEEKRQKRLLEEEKKRKLEEEQKLKLEEERRVKQQKLEEEKRLNQQKLEEEKRVKQQQLGVKWQQQLEEQRRLKQQQAEEAEEEKSLQQKREIEKRLKQQKEEQAQKREEQWEEEYWQDKRTRDLEKEAQLGSQLHAVVEEGDVVTVRNLLIKACVNVNWRNKAKETALLRTSSNGNLGMVKLLVERGASIKLPDKVGYSPLHWASYKGHAEVVEYLLSQGADASLLTNISSESQCGSTALQLATNPTIRGILEKHLNPPSKQQLEEERRHKQKQEQQQQLQEEVKRLEQKIKEKERLLEEQKRLQQQIKETERQQKLEEDVKKLKEVIKEQERLLLQQQQQQQLEEEKRMKFEEEKRLKSEEEKRLQQEEEEKRQKRLLQEAEKLKQELEEKRLKLEEEKRVKQEQLEEETRKASAGAANDPVEPKTSRQSSPTPLTKEQEVTLCQQLHTAASNNDVTTLRALLATHRHNNCVGALNMKYQNQETPIVQAAYSKSEECVKVLMEAGADLNTKDSDGWTALHWAAYNANVNMVATLLQAGADTSIQSKKGSTAFKNCKHAAILELFAAYGTNKNNNSSEGQDPVAPKLSGDEWGEALILAAGDGAATKLTYLLNTSGADNNVHYVLPETGENALMRAAGAGHETIVTILISKGVQIDEQDKIGRTALHYACLHQKEKVLPLLLHAGANPFILDKEGKVAFQLTTNPEMQRLIEEHEGAQQPVAT